jgi:hypothetical protein
MSRRRYVKKEFRMDANTLIALALIALMALAGTLVIGAGLIALMNADGSESNSKLR